MRETGAELLKRFGIYVEGINFDRDVYGFENSGTYFENENNIKYSVLQTHKNILYYYLEQTGDANNTVITETGEVKTIKQYIKDYIAKDNWDGSCRGMVMTVILDKFGKLDLAGNFGATNMNLKSLNIYSSQVYSAINYYQVSQSATTLTSINVSHRKSNSLSTWKSDLNSMPSIIDNYGIILFGIDYNRADGSTIGHSLALYDYKKVTNGYEFYVYDPNDMDSKTILTVDYVTENGINTAKLNYNNREVVAFRYAVGFDDIYHKYNRYDLDSYYNDFDAGTSATASVQLNGSDAVANNTTYLQLTLSGPFEVHNAEGEILTYNNGAFGGNMKVYSEWTANEGTNETLEYFVEVNNSDSFTIIHK